MQQAPVGIPSTATPTVEIRIPISANEKFLRMLHYFLESLQTFGGPLAQTAHCVVSVSRDEPHRDLSQECRWAADYSVEFQWMDQDLFDRLVYHGTAIHRLQVPSKADIVILADTDLLVTGDFDRIILEAYHSQRLLGCIAHVSPFDSIPELKYIPSHRWWNWIFEEAGLSRPDLKWVHTGWGQMSKDIRHRRCPDYFNYGFIVAPRAYVERMGETFEAELDAVERVVESWAKSQIANTLAFARHGIPCGTLPINYNFPLHVPADQIRALNPDPEGANSVEDVKIFHYLGKGEINKEHFATQESLAEVLNRSELSEAGSVFQHRLKIIHEKIMPDSAKSFVAVKQNLFLATSAEPSVFIICGGRRTGTTLLSAILSSDVRTNPLGQESQILTRMIEAYRWGRKNFEQFGRSFFSDPETYRAFFEETAARFSCEVSARISPDGMLVLKNPELSRVLLDVIDLFPRAKFLVTVRDPRDQVASEFEVGARRRAAGIRDSNFEERNVVALAKNFVSYYPEIIEIRRRQPERIHIIRYEDLVLRPDEGLDNLRAVTGLELAFDPTQPWLRVTPLISLHSGPSQSDLYGAPIDTRPVGRFERDLSVEEAVAVEVVCADLMDEFGYSRLD